jgi:sugar lactone lactonase YvrE
MRGVKVASLALGLIIGVLAAVPASAWQRGAVNNFFTLPDLIGQPTPPPPPPPPQCCGVKSSVEGLTVGIAPDNNIYAASSGINSGTTPPVTGPANLFVIGSDARLVRQVVIANSSSVVHGIRFNPITGALWVLDAAGGTGGNGQVLNVDKASGSSSVIASGFPADTTLNALTFDKAGNGYVTDSTNGAIYKIPSGGGSFTTWSNDPLLKAAPGLVPSFGANGIEVTPQNCDFVAAFCQVFVANTANRQIIEIVPKSDGSAGTAQVFVNGINGPDGIAINFANNDIWVAANQEDEIVVIQFGSPTATKVIAKLGDFHSINANGSINGLLFPASLAFSNDGSTLYVSNLASPTSGTIDSAWARQVKIYNLSSLSTTIPPVPPEPPTRP